MFHELCLFLANLTSKMARFLIITKYIIFLIIISIVAGCAKLGSPPGGEKDEDPPIPIKAKPANYSTNYDGNKIMIKFDEFIQLKNQYREFTVSPPLEETPIPLLRGKKIIIDFPHNKLDSLTYTLDFGQSISDNNENNPLPNFQFVVSKQPYIDSFSIKGIIIDAFTHEPDKEQISIFMSRNLADSVPFTTEPSYLGRSNPKGEFAINQVAPGTYSVYAIKDGNNNMIYDLPTEVIAFLDQTVTLHPDSFPEEPEFADSVLVDSILKDSVWNYIYAPDTVPVVDSILTDSVSIADSLSADSMIFKNYGYSFNLYSFVEEEPFSQYLVDYNRDEQENLKLFFNEPQDSLPPVRLIYPDTVGQWYYTESNPTKDSLVYWLADSNLVNKDSIIMEITYPLTDTNNVTSTVIDTLLFRFKVKGKSEGTSRGRGLGMFKRNQEEEADTLAPPIPRATVTISAKKSGQDLNVPVIVEANAPILEYNTSKMQLFRLDDTLEIPVDFRFDEDINNVRKFKLFINYEPYTSYKLVLNEGCFYDMYKRTIDTTITRFTTQRDDYYGIVNLKMENISCPTIVQLFSKDEKLTRQKTIYQNSEITFDYLYPGNYTIKVIFDDNDNGKWDTGNLYERIQPERVEFYDKKLEVRSNWEVEYIWEFE